MKFDAKGNTYVAQVELVPGGHELKISSEDWTTVDLGAAAGVYSFTLDTSNMAALAVTGPRSTP
jgi:hypothetical protein